MDIDPSKEYVFVPDETAGPRLRALHGATVVPIEMVDYTKWAGINVWRTKIRGFVEYVHSNEMVDPEEYEDDEEDWR